MRASGYALADLGYYVEPPWLIDALIAAERPFTGRVWDPFCGSGTIPRCLARAGIEAIGSDIQDRGYGLAPMDFFTSFASASSIVSNPPFQSLEEAARRAISLVTDRVALLGRLAFLEGQERGAGLWREHPPARVWVSSRRASMPPGGTEVQASGGTIAFAWYVWEIGFVGKPVLGWL